MATHRYVPILRWKEGEKNGLRAVLAHDKAGVTPIFVLASDQYKGKKATKSAIAVASADNFVSQVLRSWGSSAFYLDASGIASTPPASHPILAIAAAARSQGAHLIPATPLGAHASYASAVAAIVQHDKRGVALRIDLQEITSAPTWAPSWPHALGETDLIADFANDIGSVTKLGTMVHAVFQQLYAGKQWRSVTVAGTSMPSNFAGINSGLYTINMETYALWQLLQSVVSYKLDYGDYATPPLGAMPPDIAWGYPINARYTVPGQYLICKGVKTTGINAIDMASQLTGHAKSIVGYAHRNRLSGCWADDEIDAIASGQGPQGLLHWVKIGVNRHLTLMRRIIP